MSAEARRHAAPWDIWTPEHIVSLDGVFPVGGEVAGELRLQRGASECLIRLDPTGDGKPLKNFN